jgi:hypothetical protein
MKAKIRNIYFLNVKILMETSEPNHVSSYWFNDPENYFNWLDKMAFDYGIYPKGKEKHKKFFNYFQQPHCQ